MELSVLKKPKLSVALDIGSTYSGYAWQWREDFDTNPSRIHFNSVWEGETMQYHKTSTCILLKKKQKEKKEKKEQKEQTEQKKPDELEVDSIGFRAENRYSKMLDETDATYTGIEGKWYFFKFFKMILYHSNSGEQQRVDDYLGQPLPLIDVMSKFIGALKDHFLAKKIQSHSIPDGDILWVLTVPAIWSDEAKYFMRSAAEKAGIMKRNLLLALEPEAAAIHCMFLSAEEKAAMDDFGRVGDKFIVADLGGGTADISAQEVKSLGQLEAIIPGEGSRTGGQDINNAFFMELRDLFNIPGNPMDKYWAKHKTELLKLEQDFERSKLKIGMDEDEIDEQIDINLPRELREGIDKGTIRVGESQCFQKEKSRLVYKSQVVREKFFEQVIDIVATAIKKVLMTKEGKGIYKVVLVGGFASSGIVKDTLENKLKDCDVKILVPSSPSDAVMQGAVLYGHNPMIFRSRVIRYTYGVSITNLFKEGTHDEKKKHKQEDGQWYCSNIFDIHVRKDERVVLGEKQPLKTYTPTRALQTAVSLPIYATKSKSPMYVTDEGCKHLATLRVEMPDTTGGMDRNVKVTMIYGGTELAVEAIDVTTGKEFVTKLSF